MSSGPVEEHTLEFFEVARKYNTLIDKENPALSKVKHMRSDLFLLFRV